MIVMPVIEREEGPTAEVFVHERGLVMQRVVGRRDNPQGLAKQRFDLQPAPGDRQGGQDHVEFARRERRMLRGRDTFAHEQA